MNHCEEDGCRNPVSKSRPASGLCDACWQLSYEQECEDRQQMTFNESIAGMMESGDYTGLFNAITGGTKQ